ncbi:MAG: hypothetical protein HQL51_16995, partial [Magnetococcales bacterium]|nr:hypothetical protein [Magnetococcales bacterium]
NESPAPKVAKVDEEEDLGDDSKEDPHLKEKPRQRTEEEEGRDEYDRQSVFRAEDAGPPRDDRKEWIEAEKNLGDRKPDDERDYWLNQANHDDKEPPKSDSSPERQEEPGRWESSDGSWGTWNALRTGVSLKEEDPADKARKEAEQWLEERGHPPLPASKPWDSTLTDVDTRLEGRENEAREPAQETPPPQDGTPPQNLPREDAKGTAPPAQTPPSKPTPGHNKQQVLRENTPSTEVFAGRDRSINPPRAGSDASGDAAKFEIHPAKVKSHDKSGQSDALWKMKKAMDARGISETRQRAYWHTQTFEGISTCEADQKTCSGVQQPTLDNYIKKGKVTLPQGTKVKDLMPENMADFHEAYAEEALKKMGGAPALDEIGHWKVAAAMYDTVFQGGEGLGSERVRKAIERTTGVKPNDGEPTKRKDPQGNVKKGNDGQPLYNYPPLGENSKELLKGIAQNDRLRREFLDDLKDVRIELEGKDVSEKRYFHTSFPDPQ